MKNTSIFIPLLLIVCLGALIYLFFAALQAAEDDHRGDADRIVLNAEDYRDPDPATDVTLNNAERTDEDEPSANTTTDNGDYLAEVPASEKTVTEPVAPPATNTDETRSAGSGNTATATTAPSTSTDGGSDARPASVPNGRYLVIAGTFRQQTGANERVDALRIAGFTDARTERFNRGTYAVALAGQFDRYRDAERYAAQVADRGFEVRVMKRR